VQRVAILIEYRIATIWSRAAKAELEEFLATGRVALDAESAFPAGRPRHHDVITRRYADHGRTNRFDDAGTFVTQHRWERRGIILISNEHVCMADASSDHPDDYILRTRRVDTGPLDLEPSPFLPHDSYRDIVPRFHVGARHYKISFLLSDGRKSPPLEEIHRPAKRGEPSISSRGENHGSASRPCSYCSSAACGVFRKLIAIRL
jgi:hypothetical protein